MSAPGWPNRCWCGVYHYPHQSDGDRFVWTGAKYVPRAGLDPDPPRCWSCGHPFDAGCECSCCYDDHSEEPDPYDDV